MRRLALLLCGALLAALCGCSPSEPAPSPSGLDENGNWLFDDVVYVGRIAPLTGELASFGSGTPYVEQAAFDEVNARGGVVLDGRRCRLELICADTGSDPLAAGEAAEALINEGADVMLVSHTADTVSPVSAVCERAGVLCVSVDAPGDAWLGGGPYENSWHAFFNNESEISCFADAWDMADSNKVVGLMAANDIEGIEMAAFIVDYASFRGYTIVDPGRYTPGSGDYERIIETLSSIGCDIVAGVMMTADFTDFWTQCRELGYAPKLCTMAKGCLFESDVERLGPVADGLVTEVWWTGDFPFTSSITGGSCAELAADYLATSGEAGDFAPPTLGYKHANVEILYDILKRAGSLDREKLNAAAAATSLDTVVGHVAFNEEHISVMNSLTGQWRVNENGEASLEIICNRQIPSVKTTARLKTLR